MSNGNQNVLHAVITHGYTRLIPRTIWTSNLLICIITLWSFFVFCVAILSWNSTGSVMLVALAICGSWGARALRACGTGWGASGIGGWAKGGGGAAATFVLPHWLRLWEARSQLGGIRLACFSLNSPMFTVCQLFYTTNFDITLATWTDRLYVVRKCLMYLFGYRLCCCCVCVQ